MKATQAKSAVTKVKPKTQVKAQTNSSIQSETKTNSKIQTKAQSSSRAKKTADPLSMCPVDGAGWCPYPFSVAQLKKRLKAKAQQT